MDIAHPAWIEVDLDQFARNVKALTRYVAPAKLCLPIKANAYGHGLLPIARAAIEAGADQLAVAHLQEGIALRKGGITNPILVLGAIHEEQIEDLLKYDLEFTISSRYKAELVASKLMQTNTSCRIHLEVDVGMRRTGIRVERGMQLLEYLLKRDCFSVVGLYSHLPSSDIPNDKDTDHAIDQFVALCNRAKQIHPNLICHLANSGAILHYPKSHLDMVRPGILAFGIYPAGKSPAISVLPCFAVKALISYFKVVDQGEGISYGHLYKTDKQSRIVTVAFGYGDGYRRCLANRAEVIIRGKRYPVVGAICMDQFMVDIADDEAYVGDEVTLIGSQGEKSISIEDIAKLCGTIPYEILCSFNHDRLPRVYRSSHTLCAPLADAALQG